LALAVALPPLEPPLAATAPPVRAATRAMIATISPAVPKCSRSLENIESLLGSVSPSGRSLTALSLEALFVPVLALLPCDTVFVPVRRQLRM
jgi:hypothetical protein